MTRQEWRRFLLASAGDSEHQAELANLLDSDAGDAVLLQTRADCLAYESFQLRSPIKLEMPILSMRGERDSIATDPYGG